MKASWWGGFKGVSSLSDLCLSENVDDLLDEFNGLVCFCPLPESYESSEYVSNKLSEEDEDKESDKI